ncbi:MAG: FAD-dependent oxidoreductase [Saprospiraceae bacterium]|nr:FAD-dependent oxidoreductase [Saprospiraceae bacterium]
MKDKVIDVLTSYSTPHELSALGNEAVARGALEAGVCGVFSYPGTPSTEISEVFNMVCNFQNNDENAKNYPELVKNKVYFEYSINEKVALEKAIAYSIGNKSALCVMKNVGMNVASDALMSVTYQTIIAPLVIVVCDDPGCHSSSNEQDSRYWGNMASVPVFNPATPEDAYRMTKEAFRLSETLRLPVLVRTTTRVSHSRGMLAYNEIKPADRVPFFDRLPEMINIPARTAAAHKKLLDKLSGDSLTPFFHEFNRRYFPGNKEYGIISSGAASSYLLEIIHRNDLSEKVEILSLGLIYPLPEKDILSFLQQGFKKILLLEELDPILENATRKIAQVHQLEIEILGKNFGGLSSTGEFSLEIMDQAISAFLGLETVKNDRVEGLGSFAQELPPRPPTLCSGCPHRASYYALKLLVPRENGEVVLCGDIGCSGLGALPPLNMIDTINHMGMSISMAQGLAEAMKGKGGKVVAMLGDGTFFHSGITSLLNAVYTKSNILVIIFDNRTIGMTGHQDHPGATHLSKYNQIEILPLLKGMGIAFAEELQPFDTRDAYHQIERALAAEGVSVLVSKAPCVFLPEYKAFVGHEDSVIAVDPSRCNTCHNHLDHAIQCSRRSSAQSSMSRAVAKIKADKPMDATELSCPANICNHGFFHSIVEKDYKTALDMVRDKLLFARTCGDICHRPCELFSGHESESIVPIRQLKKYVSGIESNFSNFSAAQAQVRNAAPKNKSVAIVGAGPAGLSAAYDLVREGYQVEVFEKEAKAGGLIRFAIPDFRMDKKGFDFEIAQLGQLGVRFHYQKALGKEIQLAQLGEDFDSVILSVGMGKINRLPVVADHLPANKWFSSLEFLKKYNDKSLPVTPGSRIFVIGGGNSAIDVARSAKRLHASNEAMISCIESMENMPAFGEEVTHAREEGVLIMPSTYVHHCESGDHVKIVLNGYISKSLLETLEVDYVVVAIDQQGQTEDYSELGAENLTEKGRIRVDKHSGASNLENVFVAGDICADNHMSLIGAIASGKRAAVGVRQKLEGYQFEYEGLQALLGLERKAEKRQASMQYDTGDNLTEALGVFDLFQSCEKCNHCIDNLGCPALIKVAGKMVIDLAKCTKCGLCIDVCPNNAISWVKKESLEIVAHERNA